MISLYACANILFHLRAVSGEDIDLPARMALALIMVLLTLIGGRLVPNFTREFLAGRGETRQPAPFSRFDGLSVVLVAIAVLPGQCNRRASRRLVIGGGRVRHYGPLRWYGWLTWREPLVLILHWGYDGWRWPCFSWEVRSSASVSRKKMRCMR